MTFKICISAIGCFWAKIRTPHPCFFLQAHYGSHSRSDEILGTIGQVKKKKSLLGRDGADLILSYNFLYIELNLKLSI